MAQILAVALHISSCVVRRLQQDHTVLLRLTHMSCPPGPAPRGSGPARPQGLPNSSLPGLSVPRCLQARIHREPGTGGACDLLHCQQMKVCSSLGAVGLLPRLGRAQTRGVVSPQLRGFSWLLLQHAPEQRQCTVPTAQQVRWSWAAPKTGSGAVPRGALWGSPPDTLVPVPVTDAFVRSVPGTGDGDSWDLLQILLLVLLGSTQGLGAGTSHGWWALAAGFSCAKSSNVGTDNQDGAAELAGWEG